MLGLVLVVSVDEMSLVGADSVRLRHRQGVLAQQKLRHHQGDTVRKRVGIFDNNPPDGDIDGFDLPSDSTDLAINASSLGNVSATNSSDSVANFTNSSSRRRRQTNDKSH